MLRNPIICLSAAALILLPLGVAQAQDAANHHEATTPKMVVRHAAQLEGRVGDVYPLATDPVTGELLAKVKAPVVAFYQGRDLHFANIDNAHTFGKDPAKYLAKVDALIIAQQKADYPLTTCLVTGEKLGDEIGESIDKVYGNRLIRFCCPDCFDTFKKEPAKYLAKLDEAVLEASKKNPPAEVCLVSGEKLGGDMGAPVYYMSGNRLLSFCCASCVKDYEKNPAKYLSLTQKPAAEYSDHAGHQAPKPADTTHGNH